MGDAIEVRGLRVVASHGALPGEKERAQPFEVDFEVEVDAAPAALADDLRAAVDYGALIGAAAGVLRGGPYDLLETLAERVATALLATDGVAAATVTVRKLRPPVPEDVASAGVRVTRRRAPRRVHLGLGSNLGDRLAHLQAAVSGLAALDPGLAVSPVYESEPVGGPAGSPPYLNCVVRLHSTLSPRQLLGVAHALEAAAGRERSVFGAPRTLDVDVLLVEGTIVDEEDLVIPHPRMWGRAFVLAPLEDLDADLVPEGWGERLGGSGAVDAQARRVGSLSGS